MALLYYGFISYNSIITASETLIYYKSRSISNKNIYLLLIIFGYIFLISIICLY